MSWTDQKQQFTEAAARTMWLPGWLDSDYVQKTLIPKLGVTVDLATNYAPPTPQYALLAAAELLGMIEQANGCGLAIIIEAAKRADCASDVQTGIKLAHEHGESCTEVEIAEFASDCAMMALGTGVSWFDDHAEITLPHGKPAHFTSADGSIRCTRCQLNPDLCPCTGGAPFVVPSYEFEYQEE